MKKLLVLLAALVFVVPIMGCGNKEEDSGPVSINGKAPDANAQGTNQEAGGAPMNEPQ